VNVPRVVVAGLAAWLSVALQAGCRDPGGAPTPTPVGSPTLAAVDGPVPFHLQLGAGQVLTVRPAPSGGCPGFDGQVQLGRAGYLQLSAYATGCAATDNGRPGNGRHGVYRSTADVPADRLASATRTHTALGDATVFTQPYYECTNSCHTYTEAVAVILLDHPADPAYPALTVYAVRGAIPVEELKTVLANQFRA
jgi:hypothetical protein